MQNAASVISQDKPQLSKPERRALFFTARLKGASVSASARAAGVSRATGTRWAIQGRDAKEELEARTAAVSEKLKTREGVLAILRDIAGDTDESGAYRTAAARLLLTPETGGEQCPRCAAEKRVMEDGDVRAWIKHEMSQSQLSAFAAEK